MSLEVSSADLLNGTPESRRWACPPRIRPRFKPELAPTRHALVKLGGINSAPAAGKNHVQRAHRRQNTANNAQGLRFAPGDSEMGEVGGAANAHVTDLPNRQGGPATMCQCPDASDLISGNFPARIVRHSRPFPPTYTVFNLQLRLLTPRPPRHRPRAHLSPNSRHQVVLVDRSTIRSLAFLNALRRRSTRHLSPPPDSAASPPRPRLSHLRDLDAY